MAQRQQLPAGGYAGEFLKGMVVAAQTEGRTRDRHRGDDLVLFADFMFPRRPTEKGAGETALRVMGIKKSEQAIIACSDLAAGEGFEFDNPCIPLYQRVSKVL